MHPVSGFSPLLCFYPFFGVFFGFITTYSRACFCPVSLFKYSYFLRFFLHVLKNNCDFFALIFRELNTY